MERRDPLCPLCGAPFVEPSRIRDRGDLAVFRILRGETDGAVVHLRCAVRERREEGERRARQS